MIREEAIEIIECGDISNRWGKDGEEVEKMAIKALGQENILDKIRAEIDEQYDRVYPYDISCAEGLEMALGIIDKYKAESEDKE